jgi:hypothetical protein
MVEVLVQEKRAELFDCFNQQQLHDTDSFLNFLMENYRSFVKIVAIFWNLKLNNFVLQCYGTLTLSFYLGASAKTTLGVCLTELKHYNLFNAIGSFWGRYQKSYVVLF